MKAMKFLPFLLLAPLLSGWTFLGDNVLGRPYDYVTVRVPSNDDVLKFRSSDGKWISGAAPISALPDASTTVKGVVKLSVAPASATNPIAVGDPDPRVPASPTSNANKLVVANTGGTGLTYVGPGTTTTVLHGNASGAMSFGPVIDADITAATITAASLATAVTNRLMLTPATVGSIEVDGGAGAVPVRLAQGTNTQFLQSAGAAANPAFVSLSGDATAAAGGAVTIAAGAVTEAKTTTALQNRLMVTPATVGRISVDGGSGAAAVPLAQGTNVQFLQSAGAAANPAFVSLSGDMTAAAGGAVTIANAAVTHAKFQNITGPAFVGRSANSSGVTAAIAGTSNQIPIVSSAGTGLSFVTLSGDVTNADGAVTIANSAVTHAKFQNITGPAIVGRSANSSGVTAAIAGTANQIPVVSSAGTALSFVTLSGDITNADGVTTIGTAAVTHAKFQNITGPAFVGRSANSSGVTAAIVGTANQMASVNAAGTALAFVTISGDLTNANGVLTVANDAITYAKFQNVGARSLMGNGTNSSGDAADITGTANQMASVNAAGTALAFVTISGDVTNANGVVTIANGVVTLAKIANAAASSRLVGSGASGSGASYVEVALGTNLSMSGTTLNAASGAFTVKQGATSIDAATTILDFLASDFLATSSPSGTVHIQPATGSVTNTILGANAVTSAKIADGTVTLTDLATPASTTGNLPVTLNVTITNSANLTGTTENEPTNAALAIPAGAFNVVGRRVHVRVYGTVVVTATPGTATMRLRYQTAASNTVLYTSNAITMPGISVTDRFRVDTSFTVRATSGSNTMLENIWSMNVNTGTPTIDDCDNAATVTADWSVAGRLFWTLQFGTTGNTGVVEQFEVQVEN